MSLYSLPLYTCISSKFGHEMAPLAVTNWATKWHNLHHFQNLVTRWHHLHCFQSWSHVLPHCLELPFWHYHLVLSWYLHQPESHQLSRSIVGLVFEDQPSHSCLVNVFYSSPAVEKDKHCVVIIYLCMDVCGVWGLTVMNRSSKTTQLWAIGLKRL